LSITTAALESPVLNVWNESGTNRGRIGDSAAVRLRSLRYMAPSTMLHTRSGGIRDRGGCLGRAKRCSARKQDSHESQEPTRCGKWGSMARSRKRAITAFWRSDAAAATAGQSRQIPLRAAIRCRSASASKSGREQPRACRRSAPARLRRRARSPDT